MLLSSSENGILWEMTISVGAILGSTVDTGSIFYVAADSDPEVSFFHSVECRSVLSRCFW